MHCAVLPYASRLERVKAAAWFTMAGHMGGAVWGAFHTQRGELTTLHANEAKISFCACGLDCTKLWTIQNARSSHVLQIDTYGSDFYGWPNKLGFKDMTS